MKITIYFILLILVFSTYLKAQDPSILQLQEKATKKIKSTIDSGQNWKRGGIFNINLGQGSQSNWAAGGDDFSFTMNSYLGLFSFYKKARYSWDNTLDLNYGLVNTTSQGTRKNDDRLDFLSKGGYALNSDLNVAALLNFHTQFSKGFNYLSDGKREILSDFFSPAYLLLSAGLDYKPVKGLSIFFSPVTTRWIFVSNDSLSAKGAYGVYPGKNIKTELGAFATINYTHDINKILSYNGRLDLFSNYGHNPQNVDVMMNNLFVAKISKILTASLKLDLIYDDDVKLFGPDNDSPGLQLKSLIAVGFAIKW
ncbi:MAG: DUF3078 domain-containing protein [Ginsengibacter sp.]